MYGTFGTIAAYIAAFGAIQYLGTNVVFSNIFFKAPNHYKILWRQLHGFLSLWGVIYALLLAVVLYLTLPEEVAQVKWMIICLSAIPAILFEPTLNLTFRYYHLTQQATVIATRTAITSLLTVALNIYTIAYLKMGFMGWFWSIFLSNFCSFLLFFYPIYIKHRLTPIFNFKVRTIKSALRVSVPALPHYYSYLLKSSDRVVMNILGINMGSRVIQHRLYLWRLLQLLQRCRWRCLCPMYLQLYKDGSKNAQTEARKMTFLIQGGFLLISTGVCIWMKEIFQLLVSNPELQVAYPMAIFILMSYNYRPMYLGVVNKLMYQEKTKILWKISFVAGALNVILNFAFLPFYGITASAPITFFTFKYIGYAGYYMREYKQVQDLDYKPGYWVFATGTALLFSYNFVEAHLLAKAAFSLAVLVFCIFLFYKQYRQRRNPAAETQ